MCRWSPCRKRLHSDLKYQIRADDDVTQGVHPIYIRDHVSPAPVLLEELLHLLLQVGRDVAARRVVILRLVFIQGVLGDLWTAVMVCIVSSIIDKNMS